MKKILFLFVFAIILIIMGYIIYQTLQGGGADNKLSDEEIEFNESGRAKAIEDETDLWKYYEDVDANFSIKYSHDVSLGKKEESTSFHLFIESEEIDSLEGTMGFNKETALKNVESLEGGEYGENVDWPLDESKRVREISDTNAQEFMVLSRFEVCDVVFERKLYFFNNNHQIVITLAGPRDEIINSAPGYFEVDEENCSGEKRWDLEKQKLFFENLENNTGPKIAQDWFNLFDKIMGTIILNQESQSNLNLLQGKWRSIDDPNSVIEFTDKRKIDYYSNEKLFEGDFDLYDYSPVTKNSEANENGEYLIVSSNSETFEYRIVELSDQVLTLMYLPRGNTLKYERTQ